MAGTTQETSSPERTVTLEGQWQALYQNLVSFYQRLAQATPTSVIGSAGALSWTSNHFCIPSEESLEDGHVIDQILSWYRSQHPLQGAIFWYVHPTTPKSLGARLYARGVSANWEPHWMWCDLGRIEKRPCLDSKFKIRTTTGDDYDGSDEVNDMLYQILTKAEPRRVWQVIAFRGDSRVGKCIVNVTGEGVGGLFDMSVISKERKQGIGTALAGAACELARDLGCKQMILNATSMGEPVYRRVGFQSMGHGHTWFLKASTLAQPPPTTTQVQFLEAIGLGDIKALEGMRDRLTPEQMQDETLNELTPFEIAVMCHQPHSASWLISQSVVPDITSLWDLGWKGRVATLIAEHPELVKREAGRWTATPLHVAIERNDTELAKLLLTVPNDLESKDAVFRSTPLGWARHFERKEIVKLLEEHGQSDSSNDNLATIRDILLKK